MVDKIVHSKTDHIGGEAKIAGQ
ncbi:hypothetical protein [Cocleimonas flava]